MAEYSDREHFIPLNKADVVELLCRDPRLTPEEQNLFRQFTRLTTAVFHYEYLLELEQIKDGYLHFDPDRDTQPIERLSREALEHKEGEVFKHFIRLMERANFHRVKREVLEEKLKEQVSSDWGVNTHVDLSMFERLEVFYRGLGTEERISRPWWNLFREYKRDVPCYQRLVVLLKLRPHKRLEKGISTDPIYIKMFKSVSKNDLDMIMPGARVRMTMWDKAMIISPLVTGIGLTVWKVTDSILKGAFAVLLSLMTWSIAAALGGYGYKVYYNYQVKEQQYRLQLTKSLYFLNLDNNCGVIMRILDEVEEQECRETFLAYFFLWKHAPEQGWDAAQLDEYVEMWIEEKTNLKVDFEIEDALDKLERLGIIEKVGDKYKARSIDVAMTKMDHTWDNYFQYNTVTS